MGNIYKFTRIKNRPVLVDGEFIVHRDSGVAIVERYKKAGYSFSEIAKMFCGYCGGYIHAGDCGCGHCEPQENIETL